jgi:hypothetical protein
MRMPPSGNSAIVTSGGSFETSIRRCGAATPPFIKSSRWVPPPMNIVPGSCPRRTASSTLLAR